MQAYNTLGRQNLQMNPAFVMTPNQLLQNHLAQLLQIQPYQALSNYFTFGNHLMQPRTSQAQLSPTYPVFGNLLPMSVGAPNAQMLPVIFSQVGQQGLLSGSDSEEGLIAGVLMVPVDPGLQGNVITVHHAGVSISGTDSGVLGVQPALNPIGQKGINVTIQANESVLVASDFPTVVQREWIRNDLPGAGIIKPTYATPLGIHRTASYPEPTVPTEIIRGDNPDSPTSVTESWILCNSNMPDSQDYQGLTRGDGHVPGIPPKYFLLEDMFPNRNQNGENAN
ncbi:uncharacterized protein [Hyperolius riggenbachi]|uniref:uncharacterized protein n=1 Tax=Hyperolius riggenbachi TaxID=752182 RepID=UPI0035A2D2C5